MHFRYWFNGHRGTVMFMVSKYGALLGFFGLSVELGVDPLIGPDRKGPTVLFTADFPRGYFGLQLPKLPYLHLDLQDIFWGKEQTLITPTSEPFKIRTGIGEFVFEPVKVAKYRPRKKSSWQVSNAHRVLSVPHEYYYPKGHLVFKENPSDVIDAVLAVTEFASYLNRTYGKKG